ncbi:pyrethroid hydrolase Ces2e isoform X2 [Leptinotarsa decemlineata]|uniref:pyrethroid hydrolase Ces2e isoform X2 n=1 Tax=Leptinotarsa decemlineata TaxID=7539 RepID=UPI003D3069E2
MNLWLPLFSLICVGYSMAEEDIVVKLWRKKGKILGHILKSENGIDYYVFQEIPYAVPPIGPNRFKEPKEHEDWNGILNTTANKKVCMQNNKIAFTKVPDTMEITEDCLFMNVYTPVKPGTKDEALPVLFWIHAGGYFYGSGAYQYYDPKYLIDYGIVVVTMNYRLGPFGFEGHIRGFIMESGTSLTPIGLQNKARHFAFKLGKTLNPNFESNSSKNLQALLYKASSSDILFADVQNDVYTANIISRNVIWVPVIENEINSNSVVTTHMHEAYLRGDFIRVPLLTGFCSEESKFFVRLTLSEIEAEGNIFDRNVSLMINPQLNVKAKFLKQASEEYKRIYTKGTFQGNPGAFMKYLSEESFTTPGIRTAELVSKFSNVYLYEFAYEGEIAGLSFLTNVPGANNVAHTSELKYLFGGVEGAIKDAKDYPKPDQMIMKKMLKLWSNFIKYQNPTPKQDNLLGNVLWPPVKAGPIQYLMINNTLEVLANPKYYNQVRKVFIDYIRPPLNVF